VLLLAILLHGTEIVRGENGPVEAPKKAYPASLGRQRRQYQDRQRGDGASAAGLDMMNVNGGEQQEVHHRDHWEWRGRLDYDNAWLAGHLLVKWTTLGSAAGQQHGENRRRVPFTTIMTARHCR